MDNQFDALSKSLAQDGVSRRELLGRVVTGIAAAVLATLGLGQGRGVQAFPTKPPRCQSNTDCTNAGYLACCAGYCSNLDETKNCGACGVKCEPGQKCCYPDSLCAQKCPGTF
jgi:hypothetical protein